MPPRGAEVGLACRSAGSQSASRPSESAENVAPRVPVSWARRPPEAMPEARPESRAIVPPEDVENPLPVPPRGSCPEPMSPPDPAGTFSPVSLSVCGKRTGARAAGAALPVWSVASGRAGRTTVWVCSPVSGAAGGRRVWLKSLPWLRAGGTTAPSRSLVSGGVARSIVRLKSLPWRGAVGARVRLRSLVSREAAGPTVPERSFVSGDFGGRTVRLRPLPCRGTGGEVTGSVGGAGVSSADRRTGSEPASALRLKRARLLLSCESATDACSLWVRGLLSVLPA